MIDVRELERRWFRYKLKKLIPYAVLLLSLVIAFIIYINLQSKKEEVKKQLPNNEKNITKESIPPKTTQPKVIKQVEKNNSKEQKAKKPIQKQPVVSKVEEKPKKQEIKKELVVPPSYTKKNEKNVLKPSLDFLKRLKNDSVIPVEENDEQKQEEKEPIIKDEEIKNETTSSFKPKEINEIKEKEEIKKPRKKVNIKVKKITKKELSDIVKRFKKTNNPVLSLFIARKYYELGDYHKSYNYALITNQIDASIEDSWIIFAKSLVKLGKKQKAIKTLKAYIKTSQSNKAKILLKNIKTGKFK